MVGEDGDEDNRERAKNYALRENPVNLDSCAERTETLYILIR